MKKICLCLFALFMASLVGCKDDILEDKVAGFGSDYDGVEYRMDVK